MHCGLISRLQPWLDLFLGSSICRHSMILPYSPHLIYLLARIRLALHTPCSAALFPIVLWVRPVQASRRPLALHVSTAPNRCSDIIPASCRIYLLTFLVWEADSLTMAPPVAGCGRILLVKGSVHASSRLFLYFLTGSSGGEHSMVYEGAVKCL